MKSLNVRNALVRSSELFTGRCPKIARYLYNADNGQWTDEETGNRIDERAIRVRVVRALTAYCRALPFEYTGADISLGLDILRAELPAEAEAAR